jgi:hypothetical protein
MPPPSAYSFSMRLNGKEVARWRRADKADVLDDIESALSSFAQEHFAR